MSWIPLKCSPKEYSEQEKKLRKLRGKLQVVDETKEEKPESEE